jgi:hypothetical protein
MIVLVDSHDVVGIGDDLAADHCDDTLIDGLLCDSMVGPTLMSR